MADKLRVAVCDDDETARSIIASSLKNVFATNGVEATTSLFSSAEELGAVMPNRHFDLLLLDIDMPGIDGIEFAHKLRSKHENVDIIYISNREDRVFDSLRVQPVGFIRKSNFFADVSEIIGAYLSSRSETQHRSTIVLRDHDAVYPVQIEKIIYIEGQRKRQIVHIDGQQKTISLSRTMGELEDQLSKEGFIRIHKGYLVNFRFIEVIEGGDAVLSNGERLPISRRKEREVKEQLLDFVQGSDALMF